MYIHIKKEVSLPHPVQQSVCISDTQTSEVTKFSFWLLQNSAHISDYKSNGGMDGELTDLRIHPEELRKTTKTDSHQNRAACKYKSVWFL
jgi:hypothetical protein